MMGDEKQFTSGVPSPLLKSLVLVSCKEKTCAGLLGSSCSDGETKCTLLMSPSFEMQIIGEQRDFSRKLPLTSSVTLASNFVRLLKNRVT